jgi:hypothetical protein
MYKKDCVSSLDYPKRNVVPDSITSAGSIREVPHDRNDNTLGWRYWADRRDFPVPEKKFEVIITSGNNERKNFAVKFRFKFWDTEKNKLVNGTFIAGLSSVLKQFNLDLDVMRMYQRRTQFWTFEIKDKEVRGAFRTYLEDQDVEEDAMSGLTSAIGD